MLLSYFVRMEWSFDIPQSPYKPYVAPGAMLTVQCCTFTVVVVDVCMFSCLFIIVRMTIGQGSKWNGMD